jgi:hypothetical protein
MGRMSTAATLLPSLVFTTSGTPFGLLQTPFGLLQTPFGLLQTVAILRLRPRFACGIFSIDLDSVDISLFIHKRK